MWKSFNRSLAAFIHHILLVRYCFSHFILDGIYRGSIYSLYIYRKFNYSIRIPNNELTNSHVAHLKHANSAIGYSAHVYVEGVVVVNFSNIIGVAAASPVMFVLIGVCNAILQLKGFRFKIFIVVALVSSCELWKQMLQFTSKISFSKIVKQQHARL